jgi:uncharacterized membrane-anchored protein
MSRSPFSRSQRHTVMLAIMAVVVVLVILQLWLFMATVDAYLGGNAGVALPALLASAVCLGFNAALFYYLRRLG